MSWQADAQGLTLALRGDWRQPPPPLPGPGPLPPGDGQRVRVDASALQHWDANTAARLWALLDPLRRSGLKVNLDGLPDALRSPLALALPGDDSAPEDLPASPPTDSLLGRLGNDARHRLDEARNTVSFIGEVVLALGRLLRGKAATRLIDGLRQVDQTGPMSLPIVALTCSLIGLMLAYMGGAQLQQIGAQSFIADVVTISMVREMAALMTGVILAGRIGAAFAAQLATMQANEEIDALRVLGIDPVDYLVLPRLLAMLLVAPLLVAYAAVIGVLAGLPPVVAIYGVPAWEYLHQSVKALTGTHVLIGLGKGCLYIVLVALAGCREGLSAGRDAQAVGAATTTAVVKGLVWIVVAASVTTVLLQRLGY